MGNRYIRQTSLKEFGEDAQSKLSEGKVLVVGLGGLGIPVLQYLNAMGVGTLGLMDQDVVELHNLQRQVIYTEKDVGRQKLEVVHEKLREQNSETKIITHDSFLTKENALGILKNYDVIVDATDNFPTRYLINDACVILKKPFVYGALHGFEGQVSVFNYNDGPTYRCLYPAMPTPEEIPDCNENGVLGVVPGIIGTLQALEAVKVLTEIGEVPSGKLMLFNGLTQQTVSINFKTNLENKKINQLQEAYESIDCGTVASINAENYQEKRLKNGNLHLIDVRTTEEFHQSHLSEANNIPLADLEQYQPPKDISEAYVICQSGVRSEKATRILQQTFPNITFYHILGGMNKIMALCP